VPRALEIQKSKIAATNRESPLPQFSLHRYWKSNFTIAFKAIPITLKQGFLFFLQKVGRGEVTAFVCLFVLFVFKVVHCIAM
jgi:hypothetical protein